MMSAADRSRTARQLAELVVGYGANVQPGQLLAIQAEPGQELLARAVAEVAYERGALFVDLTVFDLHVKRARLLHAATETLDFVPPWYGARVQALGEHRCAIVIFSGRTAPHILDGLDPSRVGRDVLPRTSEWGELLQARTVNWNICPCPTRGWAALVHPGVPAEEALDRLWDQVAHICRLDEPDPVAAWRTRLGTLAANAARLNRLRLDALHFEGPGTDLTVGLLPGSRWQEDRDSTMDGIEYVANLPTEEVYTSPDPQRADGVVRATKPLYTAGALVRGLTVRFESGRVVKIDADEGAEVLRSLTERDTGAGRLGEVALVDRSGRIGPLNTVFYDVLLDENAASHIALGSGFPSAVDDADRARINCSEIHVDFMIGSDEVTVTGLTTDGHTVPLLSGGDWQIPE